MSRPWLVITLVIYGVVASISMVVLGWPEQTPTQVALLELAALPLQAAVAVGLWQLSRRMRPLGSRGRLAWWITVCLTGIGLVLVGVAYLGPRGLVHPGLAVIWLAVLMALVLVVSHLPRRRVRELFRVLPDEDDEDDEDDEGIGLLADGDASARTELDRKPETEETSGEDRGPSDSGRQSSNEPAEGELRPAGPPA